MLNLQSLDLITKYLDGIDRMVSCYLCAKSPFDEEALTQIFCHALDADLPKHYILEYPLGTLNADLKKISGSYHVDISIENTQFAKKFENRVSQGDIGFVYEYKNMIDPSLSWKYCWIAQAKRAFPLDTNGTEFGCGSRFKSFSTEQHKRIMKINNYFGFEAIRYIFYTPRILDIEKNSQMVLYSAVSDRLSRQIFDHNHGERIKSTHSDRNSSLYSGIFIGPSEHIPANLLDMYKLIPESIIPFSWDLPSFLGLYPGDGHWHRLLPRLRPNNRVFNGPLRKSCETICGILDGNIEAIREITEIIGKEEIQMPIRPKYKITITATVGHGFSGERMHYRSEE